MRTTILFFFSILLCSYTQSQETIYNNFGDDHGGWDYNWGLGWTIAGDSVASQYGVEQAMGFESGQDGFVTDIWVAISYVPSSPYNDTVIIRLAENPGGLPPDTADIIEEWMLTHFDSWYQWNEPIHLLGNNTSELNAGSSYWLWAIATDKTWTMWCMNEEPSLTCPHTIRREGENWLSISDETASAFRVDISTGVGMTAYTDERQSIQLSQNYPNPFNSSTSISYSLDKSCRVKILVFDAMGQEITNLIDKHFQPGVYSVRFDASGLPPGIYFYNLYAGDQLVMVKKMILIN